MKEWERVLSSESPRQMGEGVGLGRQRPALGTRAEQTIASLTFRQPRERPACILQDGGPSCLHFPDSLAATCSHVTKF